MRATRVLRTSLKNQTMMKKLLLVSLFTAIQAHSSLRRTLDERGGKICGTPEVADSTELDQALSIRKLQRQRKPAGYEANTPISIRVCFHVVGRRISRRQLKKELDALNQAFSSKSCCDPKLNWCNGECSTADTQMKFVMARGLFGHILNGTTTRMFPFACVRRWFRHTKMDYGSDGEQKVKKRTRQGDGKVLNVWYASLDDGIYGYATPPTALRSYPKYDGVVIDHDVLVGGSSILYNQGRTLAHEVGHWLGLFHTSQGGCTTGDRIPDTPPQLFATGPTGTCDTPLDTCPNQPGLDPVHNMMDTGPDQCIFEWTPGQIDVMHASWSFFRRGTPSLQLVELTLGSQSETYTLGSGFLRQFKVQLDSPTDVLCRLHAEGGDVGLYGNYDGFLDHFTCVSNGLYSEEFCLFPSRLGSIFLFVEASVTTLDFTISCGEVNEADSMIKIDEGVPLTGMSMSKGTLQPFNLTLNSTSILERVGNFECTSTGSSDVDLYTDQSETMTGFTCRSQSPNSSNEICQSILITSNAYAWLYAAEDVSDVALECHFLPLDAIELSSGISSQTLALLYGTTSQFFYLSVPVHATVDCTATAESGTIALFMSWNDPYIPACSSYEGSTVDCSLGLLSGYAFAQLQAQETSHDIFITCNSAPIQQFVLTDGVTAGPFRADGEELSLFTLDVAQEAAVSCETVGSNGDLDLFMNWDGSNNYECLSNSYGTSNEACTISPQIGTAQAFTYAFGGPALDYNITCTSSVA